MKMRNGQHITYKFKRMLNSKNTIELIEQEIYFMVGKKG